MPLLLLCTVAWGGEVNPYREVREIKTGFTHSSGIAVNPDGRIYAAGDRHLRIFGPDPEPAVIPLDGEPTCIAIGPDQTLYVGMRDHVEVLDHCGALKERWKTFGKGAHITSLSVAKDRVWAAEFSAREILRCTPRGAVEARIARNRGPDDDSGLVVPSAHLDVAAAPDGSVWVANPGRHKVQLYKSDGTLVRQWGFFSHEDPAGFTGCCNPCDFALLPDGRFVTSDKGALARIRVYDKEGRLQATLADSKKLKTARADCATAGLDVAADAKGRIYVLDSAVNRILVFALKEGNK